MQNRGLSGSVWTRLGVMMLLQYSCLGIWSVVLRNCLIIAIASFLIFFPNMF